MEEIRFHGRGGQGTVVASILMARAFFAAGFQVQTFPLFGVERRGAPVEAYLRIDRQKILVRSNLYAPDHVVVLDRRLLAIVDVTQGLKPGGWIVLNAPQKLENSADFDGFRLACVDATGIAIQNRLGTATHPIINTAMLGALACVLGTPPPAMISDAIREEIEIFPERNIQAAQDAYETVVKD